jgi:hypothetical protein
MLHNFVLEITDFTLLGCNNGKSDESKNIYFIEYTYLCNFLIVTYSIIAL